MRRGATIFARPTVLSAEMARHLVPYVDVLLLADPNEDRVALNIGGIANLTALPRGCAANDVQAFDCGPGVMLIDAFVQMRTGPAQRYDVDGALAAAGRVDRPRSALC